MGFLDRLRSGSPAAPDALTAEIAARLRALPAVAAAEAVEADRVSVAWTGHPSERTVDLTELRPKWKGASGFDRIEMVDQFIESLSAGAATDEAPPGDEPTPAEEPPPAEEPLSTPPPAAEVPDPDASAAPGWEEVRARALRAAATVDLDAVDPAPEPIGPGVRAWVPTAPAGAQSAWLTAPARLLAAVGLDVGVAFAPLTSELVVVDPDDVELLQGLLASTERIVAEQDDPLTATPFLLSAQGCAPWVPPEGHPLAAAVTRLRSRA